MGPSLVTGISGQDGSYLAERLVAEGREVVGVVRPPADRELPWLPAGVTAARVRRTPSRTSTLLCQPSASRARPTSRQLRSTSPIRASANSGSNSPSDAPPASRTASMSSRTVVSSAVPMLIAPPTSASPAVTIASTRSPT